MIPVLFVEDDSTILANNRRVLSVMRRDWDMRFVSSGEEALAQLAKRPAEVIVTDFSMPGMSGMGLLAQVKQLYPNVVRVLLCEADEVSGAVRGAGLAHRILRKPLDPAEVAIAVHRAFELQNRLHDPDLVTMIAEVGVLPSPSASVVRLNEVLTKEDTSIDDVAAVISADAGMTAKLLQVVNAAYFSLSSHITNVREAVSYLGLETVRNLLVGMELMQALNAGSALVQSAIDEIHEHSLTVAHVARELMPDRASANDAFVAALLHDVGLLVIACHMPEKFLSLRVQTMRSNLALTEVELEVIGAHHADIGAYLLDLWGLPNEIVEAVARHHDAVDVPYNGIDAVHAVHIADAIVSGRIGEDATDQDAGLDTEYLENLGVAEKVFNLSI